MRNISFIHSMIAGGRVAAAIALAALWGAPQAAAQEELHQEITVRHHEEVKPTDAVKLNVAPKVTMPALEAHRLTYGTRQIKVAVPASISTLAPAAYADTIYRSPFRGYAAAGYLPGFNLGASAGYKFIDNDRVRLNGWMQYNGQSYRADMPWLDESAPMSSARLRRNVATVGASLHSAVGRLSYLDFGLDYTYARFNTPTVDPYEIGDDPNVRLREQNVHRFNAQGLWTMTTGKWDTGIGLSYGHFGYGNPVRDYQLAEAPAGHNPYAPVRENKVALRAFASAEAWGAKNTGMELRLSYLSYGRYSAFVERPDYNCSFFQSQPGFSHALLSLRPFYRTTWKNIDLDLGLNLDLTFNCGRAFHISPAAQATWKPSNFATVYVKANGGERQNTLGSLFDVTYYGMPSMVYGNSHILLDGEVGVTVGLFKGFYSQLAAGYAIANDWLVPVNLDRVITYFSKENMKGYKLHFGLGYRYRNLVDLSASIEMAPNKENRGYYLWRDRARYVTVARVRVTPIEPLDITLGWNWRGGRRIMGVSAYDLASRHNPAVLSLGAVNNVSLGGSYRIDARWTVWANLENLFNHHYTLLGGLPSQGICGLVGATYKF